MIDITVHVITWNEEYLLPYFLRHYSFANKIVIHDNESTDNTINIAKSNSNTVIIPYSTNNQQDNATMNSIKNTCWKNDSTKWSIVCDADEFLIFDFNILDKYVEPVAFKSTGWQMLGRGEDLLDINRAFRLDVFDKTLLFTSSIQNINYASGCHTAEPTCKVVCDTELRHYSMLSENAYVDKCNRYAARMSRNDKIRGWGRHYLVTESWKRKRYRSFYRRSIILPSLRELYG